MRHLLITTALAIAFAASARAQAPPLENPKYFLAIGTGVDPNAHPAAVGLFSVGVKLDEQTYTTSTVDILPKSVSSVRQGIERIIYQRGPLFVTAKGDVGLAQTPDGTGGAFAGGGSIVYSLQHWTHHEVYFFGSGRVIKTFGNEMRPVYSFGILFPLR